MSGDMPDWYTKSFTSSAEQEQEKASVTATETEINFSKSVHSWILFNDGPNPVHFDLTTGVDTDNFKIPAKSWIMIDVPTTDIYLICAATETAAVYAIGFR